MADAEVEVIDISLGKKYVDKYSMKFITLQEGIAIIEQNTFKMLVRLKESRGPAPALREHYRSSLEMLEKLKKKVADENLIEYAPDECRRYVEHIYEAIVPNVPDEDREYIDNKFTVARSLIESAGGKYLTFNELNLPIVQYGPVFKILSEDHLEKLQNFVC